jgi:maltooligosyltrehalose trehalohydrolase
LPPEATIFFAQNHDQVGNRALEERLAKLISSEQLKQTMVLLILNPHVPMLFMGEESAAQTPFLFFADWKGEAADLTREGRRKEFARFEAFSSPELRERIPDPCDEATFMASKLDWTVLDHSPVSRAFRALTQELLRIRQDKIVPLIQDGFVSAKAELLRAPAAATGGINVQWQTAKGEVLQIMTNFSAQALPRPPLIMGETLCRAEQTSGHLYLSPAEILVRRGAALTTR